MNAYSEDLRRKIVEALGRGMGKSEAARTFSVSLSSVKRYARMAEEGRPVAPKKRPGSKSPSSPSGRGSCSKRTSRSVPFSPSNKDASICEYLRVVACVEVSRSTVCRAIGRMSSTRKKGGDPLQNETSL